MYANLIHLVVNIFVTFILGEKRREFADECRGNFSPGAV
jgi:hypothetical protein